MNSNFFLLLQQFFYVSGNPDDDKLACQWLRLLLDEKFSACQDQYRDEPLFKRTQRSVLRQFQNISRIMDCLECEKCRLHGQVKMLALQLALKVSQI